MEAAGAEVNFNLGSGDGEGQRLLAEDESIAADVRQVEANRINQMLKDIDEKNVQS